MNIHLPRVIRTAGQFVWRWWPWLLILWPVLRLCSLIHDNAINAPFYDDLMSLHLLGKVRHGQLEWHDIFAAQMEHRIAWTRLVLLTFFKFSPKHYFIAQVWFTWVLLCLTL